MKIEIFWTDRIKCTPPKPERFAEFAQRMANRLAFGEARYGAADARQKYLTRLKLEIKAYERTGNVEHLYNVANYAVLETIAPENRKFRFDGTVGSATRGRVGGGMDGAGLGAGVNGSARRREGD